MKSVSCQGADVASGAGTAKKTQRDLYFWGECLHVMSDHSMAWIFWISLMTFYEKVYSQNIPSIFVYFSRGGAWYVEGPAAGFRSFAGIGGGSNGVNMVVRKLR